MDGSGFWGRVEHFEGNILKYGTESDYCLAEDPEAYTEEELFRNKILWELNCGMILRDWQRVRNAVLMLSGEPKFEKRGRKPKYGKKKEGGN